MKPNAPSIVEFITDPALLGLSISPAQETLLRAIYGLPLAQEQQGLYQECTGRTEPPVAPFPEVTVVAGARAGKDSRIAAPIVCYEALFGGHERHLHRGERAVIPLVAQDQRATRIAYSYIRDYLTRSSLLASMVAEVLASEIMLVNGLAIYCFPSSHTSLRGWSIPAAVMDEVAFYRLEGAADSDAEIQASIRRGMVGFAETRLVKVSTPYMKSGVLFDDFKTAWGQDNPDLLVWRAASTLMNPSLRLERLERERRLDPQRFAREYEAEFAEDVDAFLPSAWVEDAVIPDRHELPPGAGEHYVAAVDPSGGGADAFTLAVVHTEGQGAERRVVQDVMKGWSRIGSDLSAVVKEIVETIWRYGLREVTGDRYAGNWVRQAFQEAGVMYREAAMDKAQAYLESEPLFAQSRIELLDHPQLIRELKILERRPRTGGRTVVDHPRGGRDDYANALCLAAAVAVAGTAMPKPVATRILPAAVRTAIRENRRW